MLITIYGVNNIGKTTHTKRLVERLKAAGHDAVRVKYPAYDVHPSGDYLHTLLRSGGQAISEHELQLWFIINRHQFQPQLKQWLDEGKIVVAEDYVGTGIAWGTTKGLPLEWMEAANRYLLQEDLAILIDGERAEKSIESGHIHEEKHDLIAKCREVLLGLAEKHDWKSVPLQPTKDETAELIWKEVAPHLPT